MGILLFDAFQELLIDKAIGYHCQLPHRVSPFDDDDAVPTRVAEELKLPVFYPGIVMEGGAVDFNGAGTVLMDGLPSRPRARCQPAWRLWR